MQALSFKLTKNSRPVEIEDFEGNKTEWELREMTAANRDSFLTKWTSRCHVTPDGSTGAMKDFDGSEADLISRTLFRKSDNKPAEVKEIQTWPAGAVSQIFRAAWEMNRLDKKGEGEAPKND